MKKEYGYILVLFVFMIASCGRKPINQTAKVEHTYSHIKDSVVVTEISKPIYDTISVQVPQYTAGNEQFNEEVNKKVTEILKQLQSSKTSGDLSYKIAFDEVQNQLKIIAKINETKNKTEKTSNNKQQSTINQQQTTIQQKYVPTYVKYLAYLGVLAVVFIGYKVYKIINNAFL